MRVSCRCPLLLLIFSGGAVCLVAPCPRAECGENARVAFASSRGAVAFGLGAVARIAERKLARFECAMVFSDFRDASGRPLAERLIERRLAARDYFDELSFYDGFGVPLCSDRRVAAATVPGSNLVAICTETFNALTLKAPGLAADVLIHEMLHGLGLRDDRPTSEAVTAQVVRRCGR
jgi:hypothetical protein